MLKNYFKIAWRNLQREKFFSFINISGIAVSMAVFLLIINFVHFETSYESIHENASDIYRVTQDYYQGSELVVTDAETSPALAPFLKSNMPDVVDAVRVQMMEDNTELQVNNEFHRVERIYAVDPTYFSMFNHHFIHGDSETPLEAPMQALLTESVARELYGSTTLAMGQVLENEGQAFMVTGVIEDSPLNTHLKVNILVSISSLERFGWDLDSWNSNNNYTYVQLGPEGSLTKLNEALTTIASERHTSIDYTAEPMLDIHLHSDKTFEPETNGNIRTIQFLFVIAILILVVSSVNYINLTTARSAEREKEVAMRKVLGSSRSMLVKQFLTETVLINLVGFMLAIVLIQILLPFYFQLLGRPPESGILTSPFFLLTSAGLFVFNCFISGSYPAYIISSFRTVSVTRRVTTSNRQRGFFRRVLVVGQFSFALIVLSASLIVFDQLSFMQNQDLGMSMEQILVLQKPISGPQELSDSQNRAMTDALLHLPGVESASASGSLPGSSLHTLSTTSGISRYGSDISRGYNYYMYGVDEHFIETLGLELIAGQNFDYDFTVVGDVILNEEAVRLLGFEDPEVAIGERISLRLSNDAEYSTIVGVLGNYHQQSLKNAINPMVHWYSYEGGWNGTQAANLSLKLNTNDLQRTMEDVRAVWEAYYPSAPIDYYFFDEQFNNQYLAEERLGQIVMVFSFFTLFITCLGLLGLTAYTVQKRGKEIGIRKVLGASVQHIVRLLSGDVVKLMMVSIVLALPVAWIIMDYWLRNFTYRIDLNIWMFLSASLIVAATALLAVSWQSVRAAMKDPVNSLRSE